MAAKFVQRNERRSRGIYPFVTGFAARELSINEDFAGACEIFCDVRAGVKAASSFSDKFSLETLFELAAELDEAQEAFDVLCENKHRIVNRPE